MAYALENLVLAEVSERMESCSSTTKDTLSLIPQRQCQQTWQDVDLL